MKDALHTNTHYTSLGSTALKARRCTLTLIEGGRGASTDAASGRVCQRSASTRVSTSAALSSEMAVHASVGASRTKQTSQFFVNRTRVLTLGFGLVLATFFALSFLQTPAGALFTSPISASTQTKEIVAQPGDSLWKIAANNPVEGMTTQQLVNHIMQHNQLNTATLTQGQKLIIPDTRK